MKIAIVGAGAMGCLFGAYLAKHNEVFLIDSSQVTVDAINRRGITIKEMDDHEYLYKDHIVGFLSGQCNQEVDLVIFFVKSIYLDDALKQNMNLFNDDTIVLSLQNGAGNDRKIGKYVKKENIIIGTTKHNGVSLKPGCSHHTGPGVTIIGSNHDQLEVLEKLKNTLEKAGYETIVSTDIQRIIWEKLFVNLSVNAFTAITLTPIGYMIKDENAWAFATKLINEAIEVAKVDGTTFNNEEVFEKVRKLCVDLEDGYSSMYQDVTRKQRTEIDAINGVIVEQAKLYDIDVPYNSLIVDLIHAIEGAYKYKK